MSSKSQQGRKIQIHLQIYLQQHLQADLKTPRSPLPHNINGKVNLKKPLTEQFIKTEFAEVFDGLGRFPGEPYKLKLKPDAIPARHRPRKVPVHLEEAFHEEISRLCKIDVLEPVKDHTDWVNSYVIVEKEVQVDSSNGHAPGHTLKKKLRICLDPKDLNEALEREPYYSRTVDELISKFNGAVFFTIVDLDKGYWQVMLHPDSRKYTCMALDIGRFQWKRLPMGTIIASDIFQQKLDSIYIGLPGVTGIADDMIIYGTTEDEHDQNLLRFLQVTRDKGLRLNKDKIQFKKTEVSFFVIQMVKGWTVTRPKEDTSDTRHAVPRGQGDHALFPRDGELPEPLFTTTSRAVCTSSKFNSQGCTLHSYT